MLTAPYNHSYARLISRRLNHRGPDHHDSMFGTKLTGTEGCSSEVRDSTGMKVIFGAFSSESLIQPSFESLVFFFVGEKPKRTSKLAKMAFIGPETVRKQHGHNSF